MQVRAPYGKDFALPHHRRDWVWMLLVPLAFLWTAIVGLRRRLSGLRASYRSTVPVICVGNIHSGGSAKTPIVAALLKHFGDRKVAVVARGYGGSKMREGARIDLSAERGWSLFGDEPWMLAQEFQTPIYIGSRRSRSLKQAETEGAKLIVMDDGYQHFAVARDIDLVCVNADHPIDQRYCLPAGPLRESLGAIRAATAIILTGGSDLTQSRWRQVLSVVAPGVPLFVADRRPIGVWERDHKPLTITGPIGAFCGIASPDRFFSDLQAVIPNVVKLGAYPDHYSYPKEALDRIIAECRHRSLETVVTTQKDWSKVQTEFAAAGLRLAVLGIEYELSEQFWYFLTHRLETHCSASSSSASRGV